MPIGCFEVWEVACKGGSHQLHHVKGLVPAVAVSCWFWPTNLGYFQKNQAPGRIQKLHPPSGSLIYTTGALEPRNRGFFLLELPRGLGTGCCLLFKIGDRLSGSSHRGAQMQKHPGRIQQADPPILARSLCSPITQEQKVRTFHKDLIRKARKFKVPRLV